MNRIILASASPRRQELLQQVGLPYELQTSGIDEAIAQHLPPRERVVELAKRKAEYIAARNPDALVIGADTMVLLGTQILEKPDSTQEAREMLYALSGCSHAVLTGIALAGPGAAETVTHCEETKVHFRELEAWEIDWYIRSGEYADKAGAYGIQGKAAIFVRSIEGCYFNVVGLPLTALFMLMKERDLQLENYLMF